MTEHPWQPLFPRWPRLRAGMSLVWPLPAGPFAPLEALLPIDGLLLARKGELHATLLDSVSTSAMAARLASLPTAEARAWRRGLLALDWRWRRRGERWLVARPGGDRPAAHTLVELIEQPAQALLREQVGVLLQRPLPPPCPHVTLYTHGDRRGIGLPDPDTFLARRVRRVA